MLILFHLQIHQWNHELGSFMPGAPCLSHSPPHPQPLHTGDGCGVISQEDHRSSIHNRANDKNQDRNPVQGHTRSAGKSYGHARWRDEHSGQQGQENKQQAQTWHTNIWGAGLCGAGSNFHSPHFMILHMFTPLETWKKNTNNTSLSLLSPTPIPQRKQAKTKQDRGKDPAVKGQLKRHSAWQEESQTHCEKESFRGSPCSKSPSHHHILLQPGWILVHYSRVDPARAAHWQDLPCSSTSLEKHPRDWWEPGALFQLYKAKGKKKWHCLRV